MADTARQCKVVTQVGNQAHANEPIRRAVARVAAIKGDGPAPLSNFALSGPFTETVLLGNLAVRVRKKILWDGANMRATNAPEAAQFIRREYRKGWEV